MERGASSVIAAPFAAPEEVDAGSVLAELRAELDRHRPGGGALTPTTPLWALLDRDGEDFVRTLYDELLGRAPEPAELEQHAAALARASMSKIEIVGAIRYGAEGRAANRRVSGLLPRYLLRRAGRLPGAGWLVRG